MNEPTDKRLYMIAWLDHLLTGMDNGDVASLRQAREYLQSVGRAGSVENVRATIEDRLKRYTDG